MAIEKTDEQKKPGETEDQPTVGETILASSTKEPDQTVVAEDAIRHFAAERLSDFYAQIEGAIDSLESWITTQGEDAKSVFAERGFFDTIGDRYISQLLGVAGGRGTPIMDALATETDNTVSWAQHAESDMGQFLNYMRRGARDACWYVRDALPSILSNQWPQLLDLAYEGTTDFIPALHAMGMPGLSFKPTEFSDSLIAHADAYRKTIQPKKEQAIDQQVASDDKKQEIEDESKKISQDEDLKKSQQQRSVSI